MNPHTPSRSLPLLAALPLALLVVACDSGPDPAEVEPVATSEVRVVDNDFDPVAIEVPVGTEVTWTWAGSANHNVVAEDDSFASDVQSDGTFSHTFTEAGTYRYTCTLHSGMDGLVEVVEEG